MQRETFSPIQHYPYSADENVNLIRCDIGKQINSLIGETKLPEEQRDRLAKYLRWNLYYAESLFAEEESARSNGEKEANLFYHNKHHAIYQTSYDAIYILRSLLQRNDKCSENMSIHGIVATVIAATYHDTGYVSVSEIPDNYAARTPVHVSRSNEIAEEALAMIKLPSFLQSERIKQLVSLGIYATNFPFLPIHNETIRERLDTMTLPERREARIVQLAVRLADLGGQTARIDYKSRLLFKLREEMNCAKDGFGNIVMGTDQEIYQKNINFINSIVKPTVGKIANALFKGKNNDFYRSWENKY